MRAITASDTRPKGLRFSVGGSEAMRPIPRRPQADTSLSDGVRAWAQRRWAKKWRVMLAAGPAEVRSGAPILAYRGRVPLTVPYVCSRKVVHVRLRHSKWPAGLLPAPLTDKAPATAGPDSGPGPVPSSANKRTPVPSAFLSAQDRPARGLASAMSE